MSSPHTLTLVVAFRDRDLERVERFLDSLAEQTYRDFHLVFVDYGSEHDHARECYELVSRHPFSTYLYSDTRGRPWNRAHALNTGARQVDSPYLMTTDVDLIFPPDFLEHASSRMDPGKVLYCFHRFLPRGFAAWDRLEDYRTTLRPAGRAAFGACQIVGRSLFDRIRGFDEAYCYWGVEDRDIHHRLVGLSLEEDWLNDVTCTYHQWHPEVNWTTRDFMPEGHWPRMQAYYFRNRDRLVRNSETWGELVEAGDRPVLAFLDLASRRLRDSERLHIHREAVDSGRALGRIVEEFWNLPPGHALVLPGSVPTDGKLTFASRVLRRLYPAARLYSAYAPLRAFLAEFLATASSEVADYYLDFPSSPPVSLLVRR